MANPLHGEARVELDGGRELTLRFDFDACMEAEEIDGRAIDDMLAEMAGPIDPSRGRPAFRRPKRKTQLHLLYGATRFHHREMTLPQCKDLLAAHPEQVLWPLLSALGRFMGRGQEIDEAEAEGGEPEGDSHPMASAPGIGGGSATDGAQLG